MKAEQIISDTNPWWHSGLIDPDLDEIDGPVVAVNTARVVVYYGRAEWLSASAWMVPNTHEETGT